MSWGPSQPPEPRPDTTAAGNALLYVFGSLLLFGVFLVTVPGQEEQGRVWLWTGLVLLVLAAVGLAGALRARIRYVRGGPPDRMSP